MAVTNDQLIQLKTGISGQQSKEAILKSHNSKLQELSGTAVGDTNLGASIGNVIPDNATVKQALQALEARSDISGSVDTSAFKSAGNENTLGLNNTDTLQTITDKLNAYVASAGGATGKVLNAVFLATSSNISTLQALDAGVTVDDFLFEWDTDTVKSYTIVPLDKFVDSGAFTSVAFKGIVGSADETVLVFTAVSGSSVEIDLARFVDVAGGAITGAEIVQAINTEPGYEVLTTAEKAKIAEVVDPQTLTILTNRYNGILRLADGFDPTGETDDSQLIRDAAASAKLSNEKLILPAGVKIGVGSTIDVDFSLEGSGFRTAGSTSERTVFKSLITDGSPVLKLDGARLYSLQNFQILGNTNALNPEVNSLNCIGLQVGDPDFSGAVTDHACTGGTIENVDIFGCRYGFRSLGWSNHWKFLHIRQAYVGAYIDRFNGGSIDFLRLYNCNQYFKIRNSSSIHISSLSCEGGYESISSTIDGGVTDASGGSEKTHGVHIANLRYENSDAAPIVPFLKVGFNSPNPISNFSINSGLVDKGADGIDQIQLDNVNGYNIQCYFSGITGLSSTSNTRQKKFLSNIDGYSYLVNKFDIPALNLFPNPNFSAASSTAIQTLGGSDVAVETLNFLSGNGAQRITARLAKTSAYARYTITDSDAIKAMKSDSATIGAWFYIPDTPGFDPYSVGTAIVPQIVVQFYNGTTITDILESNQRSVRKGGWSFLYDEKVLSATDFDSIQVLFYVNNSSVPTANATEHIIVDSCYLCPGMVADKIYSGNVTNSTANNFENFGNAIKMKLLQTDVSAILSHTKNTWSQGDSIEFKDPVEGGYFGSVCVTSGVGSAAIWKGFGTVGTVGGTMTGAEIATAYEAEANTNKFTDAEKTKVNESATSQEVADGLSAMQTTIDNFATGQKLVAFDVASIPADDTLYNQITVTEAGQTNIPAFFNGTDWVDMFTQDVISSGGGFTVAEVGATAHWLFGDDNVLMNDISGANPVTPNAVAPTNSPGFLTLASGGLNGLITPIPDATQLTFCLAFRVSDITKHYVYCGTAVNGSSDGFVCLTSNSSEMGFKYSGADQFVIADILENTWMFVAMSANENVFYNFLSGASTTQTKNQTVPTANNIAIGNVNWGSFLQDGFDVAEAIVFPSGLTSTQMNDVYLRSKARLLSRGITLA